MWDNGDSALIITKENKKILIDTGEPEKTVADYILDRKIKTLDYIIISHFDIDHCNGMLNLMKVVNVKNIIVSKQAYYSDEYIRIIEEANRKNINIVVVKQGDKIQIDKNTYIEFYYPCEDLEFEDLNRNSIVAKLCYNNFSILFTGDIEKETEEILIKKFGKELKSTVIKIPHHGSSTSTSESFIKNVEPKIALIGVGKNNKFGHPNENIIDRLNRLGIKTYRTDLHGEIIIKVKKDGKIKVDTKLK